MNVEKCSNNLEYALVLALAGDLDGARRLYSSTADKIDRFALNVKNYPDYYRWTSFENKTRERRAAIADDLKKNARASRRFAAPSSAGSFEARPSPLREIGYTRTRARAFYIYYIYIYYTYIIYLYIILRVYAREAFRVYHFETLVPISPRAIALKNMWTILKKLLTKRVCRV